MRRHIFLKTLIQVVTCQIAGCPNQSESNIANLYKRTQKKSEWMIANNMVQIWAPTYFHMLFVRQFFGRFWNLGEPLCKHFAGGWPHHFVRAEVGCTWIVLTKWWPKWTPLIYRGIIYIHIYIYASQVSFSGALVLPLSSGSIAPCMQNHKVGQSVGDRWISNL